MPACMNRTLGSESHRVGFLYCIAVDSTVTFDQLVANAADFIHDLVTHGQSLLRIVWPTLTSPHPHPRPLSRRGRGEKESCGISSVARSQASVLKPQVFTASTVRASSSLSSPSKNGDRHLTPSALPPYACIATEPVPVFRQAALRGRGIRLWLPWFYGTDSRRRRATARKIAPVVAVTEVDSARQATAGTVVALKSGAQLRVVGRKGPDLRKNRSSRADEGAGGSTERIDIRCATISIETLNPTRKRGMSHHVRTSLALRVSAGRPRRPQAPAWGCRVRSSASCAHEEQPE